MAESDQRQEIECDDGGGGGALSQIIGAVAAIPGDDPQHCNRDRYVAMRALKTTWSKKVINEQEAADSENQGTNGKGIQEIGLNALGHPEKYRCLDKPAMVIQ